MKKILLLSSLLLCFEMQAQNLVPNPSFEDTVSCPNNLNQINRAIGWISSLTPDYFNICSTSILISVPSNVFGYHYAASGEAYAGFYAKAYFPQEYREHAGTHLISNLQTGIRYYVSIKVSLTPLGNATQYCGVNKLGVLFSTLQYSDTNPTPVNNFAHVYTNLIITDTLNWIPIRGSFVADSNYSFISIGGFFKDSLTDSIQIAGMQCNAYYFLDDICVSTDSIYAYNYSWSDSIEMINEIKNDNSIKFYPNPFSNFITIEDNEGKLETIKLYDIYGQLLKIQDVNNVQNYTWYLSNLPSGIYYLSIQRKNKNQAVNMIIKL